MNYADTVRYIEQLNPIGIQLGLERIQSAVSAVGNPQCRFPVVHIAGTNGKGSTTAMISAALIKSGYNVGTFTSPAVTDLRDTIQINGKAIDKETFVTCAQTIIDAVPQGLSEFEFITVLMLCCFREKKIDIAVIECGLGGETDATNVIPAPLCAVLTPIALDHTGFLGDTVEAITAQKCGIIKPPCDVVCAPGMNEEALGVIFEKAAQNGLTVQLPSRSAVCNVAYSQNGCQFQYYDVDFSLSLCGEHQLDNALTALSVIQVLQQHGFRTALPRVAEAFSALSLPCRQEWITTTPSTLLDGGHNPHGIAALTKTVQQLPTPPTLVIGMLKDKDVQTCLSHIVPLCKHVICCTPSNPRALEAEALAEHARQFGANAIAVDDPIEAYRYAKKISADEAIVVGGSFYTAGAVRQAIINKTV